MGNKQSSFFYGYVVVIAAFAIMLVMWGAYYSFGVFFKPLLAEFGWTRAMTSGAFSLSLVLTGSFNVLTGKLTDRIGPRLVVTISGVFLALGYLLLSQTSTLWQFYLYYGIIVSLGMSSGIVPLQSTIARSVCCRGRAVRRPPASSRKRSFKRSAMVSTVSILTCAAASSMAKGMPSRRLQMFPIRSRSFASG